MFGSLGATLGAKASALESKLMLYIIVGVVALVIISLLLDGIRKFIRGLDTAALGALLIWLGYKSSEIALVSVLTNLLYLVGGTLLVTGLIVFILLKVIRRKRAVKKSGPPMPKQAQKDEKTKDAEAAEKSAAEPEPETKAADSKAGK